MKNKQAVAAKSAKQAPAKNTKSAKAKVEIEESDEFISEDSLSSGSASYMKLEKGENKFRVLSKPVSGWVEFIEKRPVRTPLADGEPEATDDENPPKKFIALAVLDRDDDEVKILELTQQSVIKAMRALANNPDWGSPFSYDINVTKTGDGMKTKYTVQPSPKSKLSKSDIETAEAKRCNLEALFAGEDPWDVNGAEEVTEYFFK